MAIIASDSGTALRPLIEQGVHKARCVYMAHLGTVKEIILGQEKTLNKVRIGWEFPDLLHVFSAEKGEQPFTIFKEFNLSMNEKATLRKVLESWRGKAFTEQEAKGFDIENLLGKGCLINVIQKPSKDGTKMYNDIATVSPLMKGMEIPKQINETTCINYDTLTETVFSSLPQFIQDKMKSSKEFEIWSAKNMGSVSQDLGEDIPPPTDEDLPF